MLAVINVILLAVHLFAVNIAAAGPLFCIWLHGRGRNGDDVAWQVGRRLARIAIGCLIAGILLGLLQLGIAATGGNLRYWEVIQQLPFREYVYILLEIAFSAVFMTIYVLAWERWRDRPWRHALLAILAATNLLYHFPPLMTVLSELTARPELADTVVLTRPAILGLMVLPEVIAFVAHFVVASVAVTGNLLMLLARHESTCVDGKSDGDRNNMVIAGARITMAASLAQLGTGLWVLVELPTPARNGLTGDDWLATMLFVTAIFAVVALLHALSAIAFGHASHEAILRCTVLMLIVLLLMTATLARSRHLLASQVVKGGMCEVPVNTVCLASRWRLIALQSVGELVPRKPCPGR